jgi:hypothetical protein
MAESSYVWLEDGVMPAFSSHYQKRSVLPFSIASARTTYSVCWKRLKKRHSSGKEVHSLIASIIIRITARIQRRNTSSMGSPLMVPELLRTLTVGHPIRVHVIIHTSLPGIIEECSDVSICARRIAIFAVGAVAVVGPQAVDRPGG